MSVVTTTILIVTTTITVVAATIKIVTTILDFLGYINQRLVETTKSFSACSNTLFRIFVDQSGP